VVPLQHFVARAVHLPRERWQLFHTHRTPAGSIIYYFYNVEQAFHRRESGVLLQTHVYQGMVGHVWSRFRCRLTLVHENGNSNVLLDFVAPPATQHECLFSLPCLIDTGGSSTEQYIFFFSFLVQGHGSDLLHIFLSCKVHYFILLIVYIQRYVAKNRESKSFLL
jgi:hypothetical protein